MARRKSKKKREVIPDPKYNDITIAKFTNKIMLHGKKELARTIMYGALDKFEKKVNHEGGILGAFQQMLDNARPVVRVISKRVGGATYQVPIAVEREKGDFIATSWIVEAARNQPGSSMQDSLARLFTDCYNNQGVVMKKRDDTHKMAEANKAFAHFKF
jgi:small subunit ribosomal protein S7